MNRSRDLDSLNSQNIRFWWLLAFQSGAINAGGFIACGRFVTHTTGFATHFGYEVALGKWAEAVGMLTVPFFFLAGAMVSSYYVDIPQQHGRPARHLLPAIAISCALCTAMLLGELGVFGVFGETFSLTRDYLFTVLLCFASGLQNALIMNTKGRTVRTTHLTGMTTDLATGLVRMITKTKTAGDPERDRENLARFGTIASFVAGSTVASFALIKVDYLGFWIPIATSFYMLFELLRRDS